MLRLEIVSIVGLACAVGARREKERGFRAKPGARGGIPSPPPPYARPLALIAPIPLPLLAPATHSVVS